jgi:hypothetical protein
MEISLIVALASFGKNIIGLVTRPYETCRRIVDKGNALELGFVGVVLTLYFILASLVKVASFRPFLLTRQFFVLAGAVGVTYCLVIVLFWGIGRLLGANGRLKGLAVLWGYSLIPTVVWFFVTSVLYVVLPPPRTTSIQGVLFSLLFLIFSTTLLFWKVTITYLSLRFGLRLGLGKIVAVLGITLLILAFYSMEMYKLGIFRIPFI